MGEIFLERDFHRKQLGLGGWVEQRIRKMFQKGKPGTEVHLTFFIILSKGGCHYWLKQSHLSSCKTDIPPNSFAHFLCPGERPLGIVLLQFFCKQLPNILTGVPGRRRIWGPEGWAGELAADTKKIRWWWRRRRWGVLGSEGLPPPLNSCLGSTSWQHNLFLISCNSLQGHYCQVETGRQQAEGTYLSSSN